MVYIAYLIKFANLHLRAKNDAFVVKISDMRRKAAIFCHPAILFHKILHKIFTNAGKMRKQQHKMILDRRTRIYSGETIGDQPYVSSKLCGF